MANKNKVGRADDTTKILTISFMSRKSTGASYLTFKGNVNAKKDNKNTRNFEYLTLDAKQAFRYLWQAFTKAPILQHIDLK